MKIKGILLVAVFLVTIMSAKAQRGVDNGTQYGSGADSIRCQTNISLYATNFKVNNYKEAYPQWRLAYEECPAATVNLYIHGVTLLKWLMSQEQDPVKWEAIVDDLMALYDKRLKYFGNYQGRSKDRVMADKIADYISLKGEKADYLVLYGWINSVIDEFQERADPVIFSYLMLASHKLMELDAEKYQAQYIDDFLKSSALFDAAMELAKAANDETKINNIIAYKSSTEGGFTSSGVADCTTMENVYASKIEENKNDIDFLKATLTLFRRVKCQENESYFLASGYAHRIEPTAESAQGLGLQAFKRNDFDTAEKYFLEAAEMSTDTEIKGHMHYLVAYMAHTRNNHQKARTFALKSLEASPNQGRCYILIAQLYAATASTTSPDPVLRKLAYCAAVDKLERARQVDPSSAGDANRMINQYRAFFPSVEEIFMHPDIEAGAPYTVGGWINERTTVRSR